MDQLMQADAGKRQPDGKRDRGLDKVFTERQFLEVKYSVLPKATGKAGSTYHAI